MFYFFFFSSRRRHTRFDCDWSSDVCSSDLGRGRGRERHAPRSPSPRRRSTSGRAGPVIIESVLTTMDARGAINFAPMGVEWGEEEIVIKPFLETTTFQNLEATRAAVINLTDDVILFAQGAIANVQFPAVPATLVRGVVLGAACSWREVEVRTLDATPPRARIVTRVVHRGMRREFLGFNRARHADRKSTRLNSSHSQISYAVFCLKKKRHVTSSYT